MPRLIRIGFLAPLVLVGFGCGDNLEDVPDASTAIDAAPDAAVDAASTACTTEVLSGTALPSAEGWSNRGDAATVTSLTADSVQIVTSGTEFALIALETGIAIGDPFVVEFRMRVNTVDTHAPAQAAAAFMYHYGSGVGGPDDRFEMIYFDANEIGFGDNTGTPSTLDTSVYNDYRFEFDGADIAFLVNGTLELTRAGITPDTARIALGDATASANVNVDLEIQSVNVCE